MEFTSTYFISQTENQYGLCTNGMWPEETGHIHVYSSYYGGQGTHLNKDNIISHNTCAGPSHADQSITVLTGNNRITVYTQKQVLSKYV